VDNGLLIEDRYRLRERLGQGGMSVVWRAEDDVLGREVAVKVLAAQLAADPELLSRIRSEARAAAALRHANIVEVYDYGETGIRGATLPFVVMELVDGRSLADLLSGGRLPWRLAVLVCAQVAAALAAAHASGIVHRDVKPGNVMVTAAGVKLVDFGISAAVGEIDGTDGQVLGTPAYLAPERISGGPVRPATDVYALGLLLYLTLAGELPWQASTATEMVKAHCYLDPAPLPAVPGLPSQVARMVRRCLAKTPGDRPSAAEVAEVLGEIAGLPPARLLQTVATVGARTGGAGPASMRRGSTAATLVATLRTPGGRRTLVAGGAAAAVAAVGLLTWLTGAGGGATDRAAVAAQPRPGCAVRYAIRSVTDGRASTAVTIRNTGQVAVPAWQLRFTLPDGQRLVRGWTGAWQQDGTAVRAGGGALPVGGSVATGFDAAYRDATALPASFALNGVACEAEMTVQGLSPAGPAAAGNGSAGPTTSAGGSSGSSAGGSSGSSAGGSSGNSGEGSKSSGKDKGKGKDKSKEKDNPKGKD
jgi:tRNA A-37 threonylcarbamoyl transferase component Bud32